MQDDRMFTKNDLQNLPVGMAYVPWQHWDQVYDLNKGFCVGTIFPCLDKPFSIHCGCKGGARQ